MEREKGRAGLGLAQVPSNLERMDPTGCDGDIEPDGVIIGEL